MIEAELKARVKDVESVRAWLRARAEEEEATYHDTYFDWPDHRLDAEGREIRLRNITSLSGIKHLLTYKQSPVDSSSGAKPEHETTVADPDPLVAMFRDLGLIELVRLTKDCQNYRFTYGKRAILATLVTVREIQGTFLEVETLADDGEVNDALGLVREIMIKLGLGGTLERSSYTEAVIEARKIN
jgi:adenylate cyclase class 2